MPGKKKKRFAKNGPLIIYINPKREKISTGILQNHRYPVNVVRCFVMVPHMPLF